MPYKAFFLALILSLAACGGRDSTIVSDSDPDPTPEPETPVAVNHPAEGEVYKILFFGNSITRHGPRESMGWSGDWGMAATAPEFDYVNQFLLYFHEYGAETEHLTGKAQGFEADYMGFNISSLSELRDFDADVIVLRFGENTLNVADNDSLSERIVELAEFLDGDTASVILITDNFIPHPKADAQIMKAADAAGYQFCKISDLPDTLSNTAVGQFENPAVAKHPSDQGMYEIAQRLYGCLEDSEYFAR